jgi:hypothetical protein
MRVNEPTVGNQVPKNISSCKIFSGRVRIVRPAKSGQSTEVRLKHEQLPSAQVRDDHAEGWNGTFDKLQKYLAPQPAFLTPP